jgi:hypothetical protein
MKPHPLLPSSDSPSSSRIRREEPWQQQSWQRMWLAVTGRSWRSLALVPAGRGAPDEFTLDVAASLARTGMMHLGTQIHVADATRLTMERAAEFTQQLRETIQHGPVILALSPVASSSVTVRFAQSADFAVLCVMLKHMRISDAKKTLDDIGRDHFIGAVTFG